MASPGIVPAAQPVKKEFSWKRLFIKAAGFGAGFALMLGVLAGAGLWYWNRPKPPKPWNTNAIKAEFDYPGVEGESNTIAFYYTLVNNTDFDYDFEAGNSIKLGAKLAQENSFSTDDQELLRPDTHIFVPAHGRTRFGIHLKVPYPEKEIPNATHDQMHDFRTTLSQYIVSELTNLDGFIIFDEQRRYEILFPRGWKQRATEPLRLPSNKK